MREEATLFVARFGTSFQPAGLNRLLHIAEGGRRHPSKKGLRTFGERRLTAPDPKGRVFRVRTGIAGFLPDFDTLQFEIDSGVFRLPKVRPSVPAVNDSYGKQPPVRSSSRRAARPGASRVRRVFPYMVLPLFVARERSMAAVEEALAGDRLVLLVAQRNPETAEPDRG